MNRFQSVFDHIGDRYSQAARVLHWGLALAILFMWMSGYSMKHLVAPDTPVEELLFGVHISIGVLIVGLLAMRVALRLLKPVPDLPPSITGASRRAAQFGHILLYLLPIGVVTAGWAEVDLGGHGVQFFGVPMPKLFPTLSVDSGLSAEMLATWVHFGLAYTLLAVVIGHVLAAIKHTVLDGHDILSRMTWGEGGRRPD